MSSSLTQLKINVESFVDCLFLLDGRLDSLSKLIINVRETSSRDIQPRGQILVNIIPVIIFSVKKNYIANVFLFFLLA